jgi:hypothetical protein
MAGTVRLVAPYLALAASADTWPISFRWRCSSGCKLAEVVFMLLGGGDSGRQRLGDDSGGFATNDRGLLGVQAAFFARGP